MSKSIDHWTPSFTNNGFWIFFFLLILFNKVVRVHVNSVCYFKSDLSWFSYNFVCPENMSWVKGSTMVVSNKFKSFSHHRIWLRSFRYPTKVVCKFVSWWDTTMSILIMSAKDVLIIDALKNKVTNKICWVSWVVPQHSHSALVRGQPSYPALLLRRKWRLPQPPQTKKEWGSYHT